MRHVYLNGVTAGRTDRDESGVNISISGWDSSMRNVEVDDILAIHSSGSRDYHTYKVTKTSYPHSVKDQYFIDMRWISKKELKETT